MKRVNKYLKKISTLNPYEDKKLADHLDSSNLKSFLMSKSNTATVRSIFNSNMRTIYGLEISQVNNLFGLMYVKSGGGEVEAICYSDEGCAQESRVKGGTQQISRKLLDQVLNESDNQVLLNTALLEIIQNEEDEDQLVEVVTQNTITGKKLTFKAKKVISSIPINQYATVKFEPELPLFKRNFFKFCQIGNYIKFLVTYKTPFWRELGLSGEGTSDGSYMWLNKERFNQAYSKQLKNISFNRVMHILGL
jgi:monoamine oxidase